MLKMTLSQGVQYIIDCMEQLTFAGTKENIIASGNMLEMLIKLTEEIEAIESKAKEAAAAENARALEQKQQERDRQLQEAKDRGDLIIGGETVRVGVDGSTETSIK